MLPAKIKTKVRKDGKIKKATIEEKTKKGKSTITPSTKKARNKRHRENFFISYCPKTKTRERLG
jgi:hypothetical protein